ncbi:hypothetical protein [Altererythrobacter sp. MTPC7]|uniref:hypothetical protein n=1 Tax=Altererythrobacter sp. MTPC7 TaxID=3056567 RepID=UPI0036F1A08A
MTNSYPAVIAAFALALSPAIPAAAQDVPTQGNLLEEQSLLTEGEERLVRLTENRVEGEPQTCLPRRGLRNMTIIEDTAVVFDYGSTIYVSYPAQPELLSKRDRLVTRRSFGGLCSNHLIRTEDRSSGHPTGNLFLGDFIPFTRASDEG